MPEGTPLEDTGRVLDELAAAIAGLPEVTDYQVYAGTAAPINFNGLVRQYYLRCGPELGDIQVNLVDKHHRDRKSHEIALAVRPALAEIGRRHGASVQVVEVPPGPPVQAPLVAEIYGPFYARAARADARSCARCSTRRPDIVDVDDSLEARERRAVVAIIDRQKAALLGVSQAEAVPDARRGARRARRHLRARRPRDATRSPCASSSTCPTRPTWPACSRCEVRSRGGARVPLSEIVTVERAPVGRRDLPQGPAAGRLGHRRHGRRHRQPAVRHVRHRRPAARRACRGARLEQRFISAARRPEPLRDQVGRRVADHLRDVPRHGARLLGRAGADLPAGGRAVPLVRRAAGDHGADPADRSSA